jgi:dextranase
MVDRRRRRLIVLAAAATALVLVTALALTVLRASASLDITDVYTDKSRYDPGQHVKVSVDITNPGSTTFTGELSLGADHLGANALTSPVNQQVRVKAGESTTVTLEWQPPPTDFTGYRLAVTANKGPSAVDEMSTAVDVSSDWSTFPRYGYVSEYDPGVDAAQLIKDLNRYHLNGLQFYDWQWKQHLPYNPGADWQDLANRPVSGQVVRDLIAGAHDRGMNAMFYDLAYGGFKDYDTDGSGVRTSWGLFTDKSGSKASQVSFPLPSVWQTDQLYLFDPGNKDWQRHIFAQAKLVMDNYDFDGWHIDTIGNQGLVYDADGHRIRMPDEYADFINAEKKAVGGRALFNPVGGYGLDQIARYSGVDYVYNEVWESDGITNYRDLARQADRTRANTDKALVIPAYLNKQYGVDTPDDTQRNFNEPGVLLANAAILASGATQLQLGDGENMLSNEYFPNKKLIMTDSLKHRMRDYSDFQVAYQNLLRDDIQQAGNKVEIAGVPTSVTGDAGTVWTQVMTKAGITALHLINLLDNPSTEWRDDQASYPEPATRDNLQVKLYVAADTAPGSTLRAASPDRNSGAPERLSYTEGQDADGRYLTFTVPSLQYWDTIWLDSSSAAQPVPVWNAFSRLTVSEANFNAQTDTEPSTDVGGGLTGCCTDDGDYWAFTPVDFGSGASRVNLRYSPAAKSGSIEFRTDRFDGPLIGTVDVGSTGHLQNWTTITAPVRVRGKHDLYVVFRGETGDIAKVNWVSFQR